MPKLLQINATANWGSTGVIAEQINTKARDRGWKCYFAYGRYFNDCSSELLRVGNTFSVYCHYIENRILDNEGLASRMATKKLIKAINQISPDVIHLHNIHDHWINYELLFKYLNGTNILIIWTFHDFWAITGHCAHFVSVDCFKWRLQCDKCPLSNSLFDRSKRNFHLKKILFNENKNLHIVAVSEWVANLTRSSFLGSKDIRVIPNGVDLKTFNKKNSMRPKYLPDGKFVIMAVASQWRKGKGLYDYIKLSKFLSNDEVIVLVGINEKLKNKLPDNIIGVSRTNNIEELAELYSHADVVMSLSSAETFGLTIVEAYACGTPVVVYNNSAQSSIVTAETGIVVPDGDYVAAYHAAQEIKNNGKEKYSDKCILLASQKYDKEVIYNQYIDLYNELLGIV